MPHSAHTRISPKVSLQASEWQVLINSGKATSQQQQAFEQWLAQSAEHRRAWRETQTAWQGLGQLSAADLQELKAFVLPPRAARLPFFRHLPYAFGALLLMLSVLIYRQPFWYADFYTAAGETIQITLSDSSALELDSGSAISVKYTGRLRRIVLHRGEAFFNVAADAARPFEVAVGEVEVRALGTAFDISREGQDMQVTVFEHAVRVTAGGERVEQLPSGNTISFKDHHLGKAMPQNLQNIDSWRRHRLIFEDRPLEEVVAALNRYRSWPIMLLGERVKSLSVTGLFDTQDPDSALQAIEETLNIKIRRLPGGLVLLTAA